MLCVVTSVISLLTPAPSRVFVKRDSDSASGIDMNDFFNGFAHFLIIE